MNPYNSKNDCTQSRHKPMATLISQRELHGSWTVGGLKPKQKIHFVSDGYIDLLIHGVMTTEVISVKEKGVHSMESPSDILVIDNKSSSTVNLYAEPFKYDKAEFNKKISKIADRDIFVMRLCLVAFVATFFLLKIFYGN